MPLRLATPADEPAIVSVVTAAFFNEALFGDAMHPYRHQYPDDVKIFWHNWVRNDYKEPRNRTVLATTFEAGEEKVAGIATWQRQGDDEGAKAIIEEWEDPGPDAFPSLSSTNNRALDPSKSALLADSRPYFRHHWSTSTNAIPRSQNWYLHVCAVHPSYQKCGFGRELVQWGLDRAREENVHASVMASHQNAGFYLRCGFDEVIGNCTEGEGNPLGVEKVKGGDILFMWAKEQPTKGP